MRPLRLTRQPGRASTRERTVRATVSWPSGYIPPIRAVQRMRLWANGAGQPGRVAEELSGGAMLEPSPFLEVTDGQFDSGVVPVELIDLDARQLQISDECMVSPVRPQGALR